MSKTKSSYGGAASLHLMTFAKNYNNFLFNLTLNNIKSQDNIIDFGAGLGLFAKRIHEAGFKITCVEKDRFNLHKISNELNLLCKKSLMSFEDNYADTIYSLNVLEHIQDDYSAIKILHKKLKPGGTLIIYVPAFQVLYSKMDRSVGHFRRYSKFDLCKKMKNAGFKVISIEYVDCLGFFASFLYKIFNLPQVFNQRNLVFFDTFLFPLSRFFDFFLNKLFGKNLFILAKKPL